MPDFSQMVSKRMSEAKRPPALPMAVYPGIVKGWAFGKKNRRGVETDIVRFNCQITDEPEEGAIDMEGVDPTKRQVNADFYFTDDLDYILAGFLQSCGIADDTFEVTIPQAVGCEIKIDIGQYLNQRTNQIENQVNSIRGLSGS